MRAARVLLLLLAAAAAGAAGQRAARAGEIVSAEEVLRRAFPPPARIEKATLYLDAAQLDAIAREAGERPPSGIVTRYVARAAGDGGAVLGYAYVDAHIVRTLPETVLVVLDAAGTVRSVEVLSFAEPPEYLASPPWRAQFAGRGLDADLSIGRGIRSLAGATLSARALTSAVRRVLAIHVQQETVR